MPDQRGSDRLNSFPAYAVAMAATAATLGFRLALDRRLGGQPTLVIFTLPIMLSAYLGGLGAGLLATGLSYLAASYYLFPPLHSFAIASDVERWQLFFVALAGVVISALNERFHRARRQADVAINQQQQAARSLAESQEILRLTLDAAQIGHWDLDLVTGVTRRSLRHDQIFGHDEPVVEWDYERFLRHVHPEDREVVDRRFQVAVTESSVWDIECRIIRRDGEMRWIWAHGNVVTDKGQGARMVGMVSDITGRKQAEQRLISSEASLAAAQEMAHLGSWELDLTTMTVTCSAEMCRLLHRDRAAGVLSFDEFLSMVHPDDRRLVEQAMVSGSEATVPYAVEYRTDPALGPIRHLSAAIEVVRGAAGPAVRTIGTALDVTRDRQAEIESIRLAAIVESSDDAIVGKDLNSIILSWNSSAERMFGYTAAEIVGTSIVRLIPDDRLEEETYILDRIRRGERVEHFETLRRTQDGSLINVSVTASPIKNAAGRVIGVSNTARDITGRIRADQALRESTAKLKCIFAAAPMGIGVAVNRTLIEVNEFMCRMLGYSRAELLGRDGRFLYPTDEDYEASGRDRRLIASGLTVFTESRLRRKDGTIIDVAIAGARMDPDDPAAGDVSIAMDITARKRADIALAEVNRRYRMLIESSPLGVSLQEIICDAGGRPCDFRFLQVNPAFELIMGRKSAELINRRILEVMPAFEPDWIARLCRVAITGESDRFERFGFVPERDYEVSVYSPQRGQFVMLLHDITERQQAQERLRRSMVELHAVSTRLNGIREQERARMARDIHDHLGQSLTALKMDVAEVRRRLKAADASAVEERLAEMSVLIDESVNDIRRVAAELRPPILDGLGVVAAMRAYLQDFGRRFNLPCVLTTDLLDVTLADDRAIALFRILQEALTNVARHAAAGRIDVALRADSAVVHLVVHDDGRGIPAEEARDPRALGLVGMRDRARLFGGDVTVSGRPGEGTTVTAVLPLLETTL